MNDQPNFQSAQNFIFHNARLLERRLFAYHFEGGPREAVVRALRAYQNEDGGFGNALEADVRTPHSQPVSTEYAFQVLEGCGALDDPALCEQVLETMALPACDWLETIASAEGGVPFVLPTANAYPHTPWMEAPEDPPALLNPTAGLAAFLLRHGVNHPWAERAAAFTRAGVERSESEDFHELVLVIPFLQADQMRGNAAWATGELERIRRRLQKPGVVELDPQAGGYVHMPLDWAPTPASFARPLFSDAVIAQHLDALAARQQPDGGWPITWDPASPAGGMEWRGVKTLEALLVLKAYGRV